MTGKEFIKACIDGGYVARSKVDMLKEWMKHHPKDTYDEDCLIQVYRYCEETRYGDDIPCSKWRYMYNGIKTTKRYDRDESNR